MAVHRETRTLPFTPEQIFDLVADVERYPDFLPLWHVARTCRSAHDDQLYFTEQTLQLGPVRKTFRTETSMRRPESIRVTSNDSLFREFVIQWQLQALPESSCSVDFSLRCKVRSLLLGPVIGSGWAAALAWVWLSSPWAYLAWVPWTIRMRVGAPIEPEELFGCPDEGHALEEAYARVEGAVQELVRPGRPPRPLGRSEGKRDTRGRLALLPALAGSRARVR